MMTGNTVLMGLAFFHRADLAVGEYARRARDFLRRFRHRLTPLLRKRARHGAAGGRGGRSSVARDHPRDGGPSCCSSSRWGCKIRWRSDSALALSTTFITGDILRFAEGVIGRSSRIGAISRTTVRDLWPRLARLCGRRGLRRGEFRNIALAADRTGGRARLLSTDIRSGGAATSYQLSVCEASDNQGIDFFNNYRHNSQMAFSIGRKRRLVPGRGPDSRFMSAMSVTDRQESLPPAHIEPRRPLGKRRVGDLRRRDPAAGRRELVALKLVAVPRPISHDRPRPRAVRAGPRRDHRGAARPQRGRARSDGAPR